MINIWGSIKLFNWLIIANYKFFIQIWNKYALDKSWMYSDLNFSNLYVVYKKFVS